MYSILFRWQLQAYPAFFFIMLEKRRFEFNKTYKYRELPLSVLYLLVGGFLMIFTLAIAFVSGLGFSDMVIYRNCCKEFTEE